MLKIPEGTGLAQNENIFCPWKPPEIASKRTTDQRDHVHIALEDQISSRV